MPFPFGKLTREPPVPSLEERVRELEKKLLWTRMELSEIKKVNASLRTQLRKFYR